MDNNKGQLSHVLHHFKGGFTKENMKTNNSTWSGNTIVMEINTKIKVFVGNTILDECPPYLEVTESVVMTAAYLNQLTYI